MNKSSLVYLQDIFDSIVRIENYVLNMNYDDFANDRKTVDAVIRNLEIIGEAAKNTSDKFRNTYDEIPWKEMAKMRDKLIHGYFDVNFDLIWETVKHDLSQIKPKIKKILEEAID